MSGDRDVARNLLHGRPNPLILAREKSGKPVRVVPSGKPVERGMRFSGSPCPIAEVEGRLRSQEFRLLNRPGATLEEEVCQTLGMTLRLIPADGRCLLNAVATALNRIPQPITSKAEASQFYAHFVQGFVLSRLDRLKEYVREITENKVAEVFIQGRYDSGVGDVCPMILAGALGCQLHIIDITRCGRTPIIHRTTASFEGEPSPTSTVVLLRRLVNGKEHFDVLENVVDQSMGEAGDEPVADQEPFKSPNMELSPPSPFKRPASILVPKSKSQPAQAPGQQQVAAQAKRLKIAETPNQLRSLAALRAERLKQQLAAALAEASEDTVTAADQEMEVTDASAADAESSGAAEGTVTRTTDAPAAQVAVEVVTAVVAQDNASTTTVAEMAASKVAHVERTPPRANLKPRPIRLVSPLPEKRLPGPPDMFKQDAKVILADDLVCAMGVNQVADWLMGRKSPLHTEAFTRGLRLGPSLIPNAGKGVFTTRPFVDGAVVAYYWGTLGRHFEGLEDVSDRVLRLSGAYSGLIIDGSRMCIATYINGATGETRPNVQLVEQVDIHPAQATFVAVVAIENIREGEELYLNYGDTYDLP